MLAAIARLTVIAVIAVLVVTPSALAIAAAFPAPARAAVQSTDQQARLAPSEGANALQDAADRAGQLARGVALSLIGFALAVTSVVLIFRRDFREAAAVFAVGLLAVLLATPSGVRVLRDTAAMLFGQ
jgi:hypothetical protein